mgnify:FL=1
MVKLGDILETKSSREVAFGAEIAFDRDAALLFVVLVVVVT